MRLRLLLTAALAVVIPTSTVHAQVANDIIVIPAANITRGAPGELIEIGSEPVPDEFIGRTCVATAAGTNGKSVHNGNDLIVSSGDTAGVVPDYEAVAFATTNVSFPLTLGDTVTVTLALGPQSTISSGGLTVSVDCPPIPETTTTSTTTTTTTIPPTTTFTTEPPLCGEGEWDGEECATTTTAPDTTPPPTNPVTTPPSTLADTGGGDTAAGTAFIAIFALLLGSLALLAVRRPIGPA